MPTLRVMTDGDLPQVNLILTKAFTKARLQTGLRESRVPLCRIDFLEMYRKANPEGSFVIDHDDKIIAYCFSRLWGGVGWIGPLSVIPAEEGKGYGKQVVGAAVETLKSQRAVTIGLEMPAHSQNNLAFYTKLGFRPNKLTADLVRPTSVSVDAALASKFSIIRLSKQPVQQRIKHEARLREFSDRLQPGLDYSREIQLTLDFHFGDASLVFCGDRLIGLILAHTETYSQEEHRDFLKVNALQMAPDLPIDTLAGFIYALDNWALAEHLPAIYLRVPTRYHAGFRYILSQKFRLVNSELRMTLENYSLQDDPATINFNKWE